MREYQRMNTHKQSLGATYRFVGAAIMLMVAGTPLQAAPEVLAEPNPSHQQAPDSSPEFSVKALLSRVESYLNGFRSLHAHFKQDDPDGTVRFGEIYIQKPGLMRIAYRGLKGLLIISDGTWLSYDDKALDQVSYVPLHTTPAALILKDKFDFKETQVERVEFMPDRSLQITVRNKEEPEAGSLTLIFKQDPFSLVGWQVMDQSTQMTVVELSQVEVGGKAPAGSFEFSGPGTDRP